MGYYKELAIRLRRRYLDSLGNVVLQKPADVYSDCNHAATAITDLLARAEAAEARYQMALERAEKAERERDAAVWWLRELCVCGACGYTQCRDRDGDQDCNFTFIGETGQKEG